MNETNNNSMINEADKEEKRNDSNMLDDSGQQAAHQSSDNPITPINIKTCSFGFDLASTVTPINNDFDRILILKQEEQDDQQLDRKRKSYEDQDEETIEFNATASIPENQEIISHIAKTEEASDNISSNEPSINHVSSNIDSAS